MTRFVCFTLAVAAMTLVRAGRAPGAEPGPAFGPEQLRFFEERVRPLLANRCQQCHGAKKSESGLRLDSRAAVLAGGDSGQPAVDPRKPADSLLLRAVRRQGDTHMPPDKPLPEEEVATLARWIEQGLPWPADAAPADALSLAEQSQRHWALQPPRVSPLPPVNNAAWPATPVDHFVLARLEQAGLAPAAAADRRTLLRRLSFDLLGLPPTPEEVEEFVADPAPNAVARQVERMLASPRYGERWGRHWLDVARYADTRGYAFGRERRFPHAHTYRDWVIGAFNRDLPYNEFVRWQLAADFIVGDSKVATGAAPTTGDAKVSTGASATQADLAALGFLTVGRKFDDRALDIDDQIDTVTRGLLGLTVSCARCHDHKYDAIPTEDYYSLYGVFNSTREAQQPPLLGDPAEIQGHQEFEAQLNKLRGEQEQFLTQKHNEAAAAARARAVDYLARVLANRPESLLSKFAFLSLDPQDIRPKLLQRWQGFLNLAKPEDALWGLWASLARLSEDEFAAQAPGVVEKHQGLPPGLAAGQIHPALLAELKATKLAGKIELARLYAKVLQDGFAAYQQAGGHNRVGRDDAALAKLPPEQRALAEVLVAANGPTDIPREELREYLSRADRNQHSELQKAIDSHQARSPGAPPRAMSVEDQGPFEAVVFIRGNPNRHGKPVRRQFLSLLAGPRPQPFQRGSGRLELADAIAAPNNPLTARVWVNRVWQHHFGQPLVTTPSDFGLRTEPPSHPELLDYLAARFVAEGWSIKQLHRWILLSNAYQQTSDPPATAQVARARTIDPDNRLLWRMNRRRLEFESLRDGLLAASGELDLAMGGRAEDFTTPQFRRRAVYGYIDRQDLPNVLRVFDFASPDQSVAERPRTTVPQQALFFLNNPLLAAQAKALAARPDVFSLQAPAQRVARLYALLWGRAPTAAEVEVCVQFIAAAEQEPQGLSPWQQYAQLLLMTNEFAFVD